MLLRAASLPHAVCGIFHDAVRLHVLRADMFRCAVLLCCPHSVSSIVLRGATEGMLDDVERAVDDGINAYKVCCG